MDLDPRLADIVRLRDEVGVLSVYVGVDPAAQATTRPAWEIELEAALGRLLAQAHEEGPHARWAVLDERLRTLAPALAQLADPTVRGRGRALFTGVGSGDVHTISVQPMLPTEASVGRVPRVVPMLRVDDGHPRALVLVGRDRMRVLETRLADVVEVASFDVEPVVADGAERKGPARPNPLRAQQVVAQREQYERHVEAGHRRLVDDAAGEISRLAAERRWELGVVAGDPRGARPVASALSRARVEVELVDRDLVELAPPRALAELAPVLETAAGRRDKSLVERARSAAASGGRGALGLADVLGALAAGRVHWLLLDGDRTISGAIGPGGELVPAGVRPPGVAERDLAPEPLMSDRMAIQALETGARVSVVGGGAAELLADADGVAAVLRW